MPTGSSPAAPTLSGIVTDGAQIVFDWKSDVAPDATDRAAYAQQLSIYVDVLRRERGAVIYMTTGLDRLGRSDLRKSDAKGQAATRVRDLKIAPSSESGP